MTPFIFVQALRYIIQKEKNGGRIMRNKRLVWGICMGLILFLFVFILFMQFSDSPETNETDVIDTTESGQAVEDSTIEEDTAIEGDEIVPVELTEDVDTFEWLYGYIHSRSTSLLSEGEFLTVKNKLSDRDDRLSMIIKNADENIFNIGEGQVEFLLAYFDELSANKDKEWVSSATKEYFEMLDSLEIVDSIDLESAIREIDSGKEYNQATEESKYMICGLRANKSGLLNEMPYYDAACVLEKLNVFTQEHPELDEVFNQLRSGYNGV